jgi:GTP cyclohydrolase I
MRFLHKQMIVCLYMMIIKSSSCQHHILGFSGKD